MRTDTINKPFLLEKPFPTENQLKEAKGLRMKSIQALEAREESWQRSDTDGCLTQWAHGINSRLDNTKAEILEAGGYLETQALFDGQRVVKAKMVESRFGVCWLLSDEEFKKFGRRFIPVGEASKVQRSLGIHTGTIFQPAWAALASNGRGLSGNVWVETFPINEPRSK